MGLHSGDQPKIVSNITMEDRTNVAAIGVKVPPFWPHKPSLWFVNLEAQYALANITADSTKYAHLISCLDAKYAAEVEDIIINPPMNGKYDKLKAEIIRRLSISQEQRIRQLLSQEEVGDRKPTQFLRHLRSLAGSDIKYDFLRSLWVNRLPSYIQAIIATQDKLDLDEVARLADKVSEVMPPQPQSFVASTSAGTASTSTAAVVDISDISKQIAELTRQVAALQASQNRSRSRSRGRGNYYQVRQRIRSANGYCWYHATFQQKAQKCRSPCKFQRQAGNEKSSH